MRALIVEDHANTAQALELMLTAAGFQVYTTDLGEEAVDLAKVYDYDAITLDLNLSDMSGLDVLRSLRAAKVTTPIVMLTGSSDMDVKLKAFRAGADDFITKPFHRDDLIARLLAIIRRSRGHISNCIQTGNILVDLDAQSVTISGRRVHLTGKEYQIIELLSLRRGTTLTKENILNHLYGGMDEPELKIIDVFVCKVRKKLATANDGAHHIETVWGKGYVLKEDADIRTPFDPFSSQTATARIVARLRTGSANSRQLLAVAKCRPESIGTLLTRLRAQGLVDKLGERASTTYVLTDPGRTWAAARLGEAVNA